MSNKKITKTIIKGLKEVKRYQLDAKEDGEPKLKEVTFLVESDSNIDELDYDLVVSGSYNSTSYYKLFAFQAPTLQLLINGELKNCIIKSHTLEDGVKTIVVNEILETQYQDYLKTVIHNQYTKKYDKYFDELLEKYKEDKGKMALINMYLQTMTKEDIVALLKNDSKNRDVVKVPCSVYEDLFDKFKHR